jgi:hypothetical protein
MRQRHERKPLDRLDEVWAAWRGLSLCERRLFLERLREHHSAEMAARRGDARSMVSSRTPLTALTIDAADLGA